MAKPLDPQRRERLLAKALELFCQRGYYGVSIGDLAQSCEMARGSLYTYFRDKSQLVNVLYRNCKQAFLEQLQQGLAGLQGRKKHRQLWHNLQTFAAEQPLQLFFLEAQHHASYLDEESLELEQQVSTLAYTIFEELMPNATAQQIEWFIALTYGGYIQATRSRFRLQQPLTDDIFEYLEASLWQTLSAATPV